MLVRLTEAHRHALSTARIGIAGAGGLGSSCAVFLARAGVRHLTVIDCDEIEASNLNRQHYTLDQVGQRKVDALADNIAAVAPGCRVRAHHLRYVPGMAGELFSDCAVVVEAFDDAATKAALIDDVLGSLTGAWLVAASGLAGIGGNDRLETLRLGRLFVVGDRSTAAEPGVPLLAPRVVAVAALQANQALALLLGDES